jgi:hypothetical protein
MSGFFPAESGNRHKIVIWENFILRDRRMTHGRKWGISWVLPQALPLPGDAVNNTFSPENTSADRGVSPFDIRRFAFTIPRGA